MAVTATTQTLDNPGGVRFILVSVTPDASYPTGGEPVTPALFGFASQIYFAEGVSLGGITWRYIPATGKIKAFWVDTSVDGAALAEVASTTDLATDVVQIFAIGR